MSESPFAYSEQDPLETLLKSYHRSPSVEDEIFDENNQIRPLWRPFLSFFAKLSEKERARRFARGDQHLRDAGVFYRQYDHDAAAERAWPLSHIPVMLDEDDWDTIEAGLQQRANLLEAVMVDIYGDQNLVTSGHLPAELIASSNEWLRPMMHSKPRGGHFLNFLAFEIGRGPDGNWWVLGDRTEAPSGAGFALENRIATKQVFPAFYHQVNVHRLAGFFRSFRDHLASQQRPIDAGVGVLTPGRLNDGYFEHAYLARYLGFMLLEGEDITIRDGKAWVRTVDGLKPISVLWRRMDASFVDPLELWSHSMIGTPGLVRPVYNGELNMVNALGSGILEHRFMLAFLPRIAETLIGEALSLPNIATWWCGQDAEKDIVLGRSEVMIGNANATHLPFEKNDMEFLGQDAESEALRQKVAQNGANYVGQEIIKLSTTPYMDDGKLVARPMTLRIFLTRTDNGWKAMPGGYARIGKQEGQTVLTLQGGGKVSDVWVISNEELPEDSLEATAHTGYARAIPEVLQTRVADNLFWLGRYLERAEALTRITRAYHARLEEYDGYESAPLIQYMLDYITFYGMQADEGIPQVLCDALGSAMTSAEHIRDRFSTDGWMALKTLFQTAQDFKGKDLHGGDTVLAAQSLLHMISGLSGLTQESMYQHTGWRFMKIGRALERAMTTSYTLRYFTHPRAPQGALDIPVDIGDSTITHRRRYVTQTNRETVVDLLALDKRNPRAVIYQINEMKDHLTHLPLEQDHFQPSAMTKAALLIQTELTVASPETVTLDFLQSIEKKLYGFSDMLSAMYLK